MRLTLFRDMIREIKIVQELGSVRTDVPEPLDSDRYFVESQGTVVGRLMDNGHNGLIGRFLATIGTADYGNLPVMMLGVVSPHRVVRISPLHRIHEDNARPTRS